MSKRRAPPAPTTLAKTHKCPQCRKPVLSDGWRPKQGLEPELRHYVCSHCRREFYTPLPLTRLPASNERETGGENKAAGGSFRPAAPP